jgi:hypothetical protein
VSNARSQIEAILFKPAPNGFIYRAPNPWVFGRADHYLVNEADKNDILGIIVARRPILRAVVLVAALVLWGVGIGTLGWAFSGHEDPTATDVVAMIILTVLAMFVALHVALRRRLRRLQPILDRLPRSNERITSGEVHNAMVKSMSFKAAVWAATLWTFTCLTQVFTLVIRNARHPLFGDAQSFLSLFLVVFGVLLAARHFQIAIRKARQQGRFQAPTIFPADARTE